IKDYSVEEMLANDFINQELIQFSIDDCRRSIPHLFDGFKESHRKVMYSAFKRNLRYSGQTLKVAQFSGYVAEHSGYHHGENNLLDTIIKLAQRFVGSNNVCVGSTIALTDSAAGGVWTSGTTSVATVSSTGVVFGVSTGSAIITYTVTNTCGTAFTTTTITVNPLPHAGVVTGTSSACAGTGVTFTTTGTGGTWSSANPATATVDATTGAVTGMANGFVNIKYRVAGACNTDSAIRPITVLAGPEAGTITGGAAICEHAAIILTASGGDLGGFWSSSNTAVATVDAATGSVGGAAAGTATISYIVNSASCGSDTATAAITVNPLPRAGSVTTPGSLCAGATGTATTTGDAGGTWSSNNNTIATIDAASGAITTLGAGIVSFKYVVTNGCGSDSSSNTLLVQPTPLAGTITGSSPMCVAASTTYTTSGTTGGNWASSNPAVASVDAS
ncbi:MAG: hypothetical protein EBZ77_15955, partial [Chitinophagia bacterium]|nr:hypothetical protein [Chitinophagia bacterium]